MDSRKVASELIELSGGTSNITNITHCSTRLRFIIKDWQQVHFRCADHSRRMKIQILHLDNGLHS